MTRNLAVRGKAAKSPDSAVAFEPDERVRILFTLPELESVGKCLLKERGISRGRCDVRAFSNGETYVEMRTQVQGRECLVLGSISPPASRLMNFLLVCHTLWKEGASGVTAVLPYLAYSRQDKLKPGQSLGTAWLGSLLKGSGIDRVVTVDLHNPGAAELLQVPVRSISPAPLFAGLIRSPEEVTFVAPDEGAEGRCREVARVMGSSRPQVIFTKERMAGGIRSAMHGRPGPRAVVVDDILDTGATLVACCRALQNAGTGEITVMVTHALFTGDAGVQLWSCGVRRVICTDTVPVTDARYCRRATVVSVAPLLGKEL